MGKVFKLFPFLMQGKYFWNVLEYNRRKIDFLYKTRSTKFHYWSFRSLIYNFYFTLFLYT